MTGIFRIQAIIFLILLMANTGCDNPFGGKNSVWDSRHAPGVTLGTSIAPTKGSEFVSSSQQSFLTSGGRLRVSATLASPTDGIRAVTTFRGYRLFSNVQGGFISQEVGP